MNTDPDAPQWRTSRSDASAPFNNLVAHGVDLCAHAASLGAIAGRVSDLASLEDAVRRTQAAARTSVIVIETDPGVSTDAGGHRWDVAVPATSDDPERAPRVPITRLHVRPGMGHHDRPPRTNPIGWSNYDLREPGADTPLDSCLAQARSAGFAGVELGHKFPREAPALRPILDRHDLTLVSGWYSANLLERDAASELDTMRPHLALLRDLGCAVLILAETSNAIHADRTAGLSHRPVPTDTAWREFASRLTGVFTVPGDGAVDFAGVLSELPGYQGWLVVEAEQDPAKPIP